MIHSLSSLKIASYTATTFAELPTPNLIVFSQLQVATRIFLYCHMSFFHSKEKFPLEILPTHVALALGTKIDEQTWRGIEGGTCSFSRHFLPG